MTIDYCDECMSLDVSVYEDERDPNRLNYYCHDCGFKFCDIIEEVDPLTTPT